VQHVTPDQLNIEGTKMMYLAAGLALLGAAIGMAFRWRALLPAIVLVPFLVTIFSVSRGARFDMTATAILIAEAVLQGGYFVGLLLRFLIPAFRSSSAAAESRGGPKASDEDRHPASPTEA
jgi:hypothetical protein